MKKKTIEISLEEYIALLVNQNELEALESYGVEEWFDYGGRYRFMKETSDELEARLRSIYMED